MKLATLLLKDLGDVEPTTIPMVVDPSVAQSVLIEALDGQRKLAGSKLENIALLVGQAALLYDSFDAGELSTERLNVAVWELIQRIDEQLEYEADAAMIVNA